MKKKIVDVLNLISTPLIVLLVYFSNYSITGNILVPLVSGILRDNIIDTLKMATAKIAIDTAILNIIVNVLFLKIVNVIKYDVKITNREKTSELVLLLNNPRMKTVEIEINIDYKFLLLKKICSFLGNNNLYIYIPEKLNYNVKNKDDINTGAVEDLENQNIIKLNLEKCLDENEISKRLYILLEVSSKAKFTNNYEISTLIKIGENKNKLKKAIAILIMTLIGDLAVDKHIVRIREIK